MVWILFFFIFGLVLSEQRKDLREVLARSDFLISSTDKFLEQATNSILKTQKASQKYMPKQAKKDEIPRPINLNIPKRGPLKTKNSNTIKLTLTKPKVANNTSLVPSPTHLKIPVISDFPYFSPVLSVGNFHNRTEHCDKHTNMVETEFKIRLPPKRMLRVSTCNSDTTVQTVISVTLNKECLKVIKRDCRRWIGNIVEFLPNTDKSLLLSVKVSTAASHQTNEKAKIRTTIYTLPITKGNKEKLKNGNIIASSQIKNERIHDSNNLEIVQTNKQSPRSQFSNNKFSEGIERMGGWFKVVISLIVSLVIVSVGVIVLGSYRQSQIPAQYSPF
ncbi:hypothetical protein EIN_060520 [Entamoeba invadens IP1]|uniref:hypothetical protein n=1 Tax=Entamoeba invadens IP1 TaxID=370355 RepID=UPI0002C3DBC1|nr:hypothetical protein EIN_060520 [Entamoeba invadens IP1]ELP93517.1 hypothetical protein EIN_060520 [Entamoeba invadens IP1]|eukprot:XP_004260288.1 hypothetical protein EIN_060520 [Entamoeba invadens IP1]